MAKGQKVSGAVGRGIVGAFSNESPQTRVTRLTIGRDSGAKAAFNAQGIWLRVKLQLKTVGPVFYSTQNDAANLPALVQNEWTDILLSPGSALYLSADTSNNKVDSIVEPDPTIQAGKREEELLGQILAALKAGVR